MNEEVGNGIIATLFNAGYGVWNYIINIAMTLFKTSPTAASGSVYSTCYALYTAIKSISIPIAMCFFLMAMIKDAIESPNDQVARRLFSDGLKFVVMLGILSNLWLIMGYVMQIADGVTNAVSTSSATYTLSMSSDLQSCLTELDQDIVMTESVAHIGNYIKEWWSLHWQRICATLVLFLLGFVSLLVMVSCALSILSSAFQRILKPLIILPFSCITVAMASGSHEAQRVTTQYIKTFFGFCISGAFMVICVKLGSALISGGVVAFDTSGMGILEKAIYSGIQNAIAPIVISGLVKGADSIIQRIF